VAVNGLRAAGGAAAALMLLVMVAAVAAGAGVASLLGGGAIAPGGAAVAGIPAAMLVLYQQAALTCPGLPWTVLASIGTIESANGTSDLPGVHSGANWAGAEGPMQFLPATFAAYDRPVPPGGVRPPSPYDPVDAVYAAARLLCANGAAGGRNLAGAVFAFNHDTGYVRQVLALARAYAQGGTGATAPGRAAVVAVDWALAQVGTPYVWGGETPGIGFDCSGLVQAAYQAAGIGLPRVAQDQYGAGPHLPAGAALQPGDLVFFGASATSVTHVGIYVGSRGGQAVMVDAPHTGADVRAEPFPVTIGTPWGSDIYLGATRPSR
jgi:cell wall-associated NlpC family hydrolase